MKSNSFKVVIDTASAVNDTSRRALVFGAWLIGTSQIGLAGQARFWKA